LNIQKKFLNFQTNQKLQPMNDKEMKLFEEIQAFKLDDNSTSLKFSDRLARENGWTKTYTQRVIDEYKKFIFLCCITDSGVTPSDPVDQAWHLHLTFTKSYWIDFCQNTLGQQIHHNPTKGGKNEREKFKIYYDTSESLYKAKFGISPPEDIWHNSQKRFSEINFQRVNLDKNWLIPKPNVQFISKTLLFSCIPFVIPIILLQASTTKVVMLTFLFLGAFAIIIYALIKASQNQSGEKNGSGGSGCSSCGTSHNADSVVESGCGGDSGCSGCGGGD
jgi:hypothetical protein